MDMAGASPLMRSVASSGTIPHTPMSAVHGVAHGEGDEPARPPAEELAMMGKEIRVPSDATLEKAIEIANNVAASQPCFIAIEPGEHHAETTLEIAGKNVNIRGLSETHRINDKVIRATVYGVWRLTSRSAGRISALDCVNKSWDSALINMLDGSWEITDCNLFCGIEPLKKRPDDGYRLLYASVWCQGGTLLLNKCQIGGARMEAPAYGGVICCKDGVCRAEECTISCCQAFALCLRENSKLTLAGCQLVRNAAVFSAGFPNTATLVMTKNRIAHNRKMWIHAPPKKIEDKLDNIDITGYLIQIYPDI